MMVYILALTISLCLISGQALWGSTIKSLSGGGEHLAGMDLLLKLPTTPRFWLGVLCYGIGTLAYFLLLSKIKFFSVQITMTGLAIIFSTLLSYFAFKESLSTANIVGMLTVLLGIFLATR